MSCGCLLHPRAGYNPAPVPQAARKVELAELDLIARTYRKAAAHVGFAGRCQVHVIDAELKRAREVLVEEFGQPATRRISHGAADQIHPSRTIDRLVAA